MKLYHYTCDHGRAGIQRDGWIKPGVDGLVWLTDLLDEGRHERTRKALGLTSHILKCDRFTYVFEVESDATTMPYREAVARNLVSRARHMSLTGYAAARPANWHVAIGPLPVVEPEDHHA